MNSPSPHSLTLSIFLSSLSSITNPREIYSFIFSLFVIWKLVLEFRKNIEIERKQCTSNLNEGKKYCIVSKDINWWNSKQLVLSMNAWRRATSTNEYFSKIWKWKNVLSIIYQNIKYFEKKKIHEFSLFFILNF